MTLLLFWGASLLCCQAEECSWHADEFCLLTDLAHTTPLSNHITLAVLKEEGWGKIGNTMFHGSQQRQRVYMIHQPPYYLYQH